MRIVVPFAGSVHPIADRALEEFAPQAERVNVGGNDSAYSQLFAELWRADEDFMLIEHDIEVNRAAIEEAADCDCPWAANPYPYSSNPAMRTPTIDLGCMRFRSSLLHDMPDPKPIGVGAGVHWRYVSDYIRKYLYVPGLRPHTHRPVNHHHWLRVGAEAIPAVTEAFCMCGARDQRICSTRRHHVDDPECFCDGCTMLGPDGKIHRHKGRPPSSWRWARKEPSNAEVIHASDAAVKACQGRVPPRASRLLPEQDRAS